MGFDRIIGQEALKKRMGAEVLSKRGNTYIVSGPSGSGKTFIAGELAKSFICSHPTSNGECGSCDSCRSLGAGANTDLVRIAPDKGEKNIPVDRIRDDVVGDYETAPRFSPHKVYIIDADHIGVEAQNALLKSIEEPPANVIFILEVTNTDTLLPTILSRAVEYKILPYSVEEVKAIVKSEGIDIADADLDIASEFADGIPGRAVKLASDESFGKLKDDLMDLILDMRGAKISDVLDRSDEIFGEYKDNYMEPVILLLWIFGDLMKLMADIDCDRIRFTSARTRLEKYIVTHKEIGQKEIGRACEAVNAFVADRKVNVGYDGCVNLMILKIYKEFNK